MPRGGVEEMARQPQRVPRPVPHPLCGCLSPCLPGAGIGVDYRPRTSLLSACFFRQQISGIKLVNCDLFLFFLLALSSVSRVASLREVLLFYFLIFSPGRFT